jgi:molybdenum cofactor cytidylyltransferase
MSSQIELLANTPLLILAAGRSSRMGFPKGLLPYQGRFLLEHQLEIFFSQGGKRAILVVGYQPDNYCRQPFIEHYLSEGRVEIAQNHECHLGQFSSLQAGLKVAIKNETSGVILLPIDVPLPCKMELKKLITKNKRAVIPTYQNRGGHPVFLSMDLCRDLEKMDLEDPSSRLDYILNKLPQAEVEYLPVPNKEIRLNLNQLS